MPSHINIAVITALALLATVAVYHASSTHSPEETAFKIGHVKHPHYVNWKKAHNHTFGASEDLLRAQVFGENYNLIEAHNANKSNTWTMKVGPFAHLTSEEFNSIYLGLRVPTNYTPSTEQADTIPSGNLLGDINWTDKGAVRRVKNQGQCGSCWAFSATGALEGYAFTAGKGMPEFSEQQLVDCSKSYGNNGCNGGWMTQAFHFVQDHGIVHEDQYPYRAVDQGCSNGGGAFRVNGWVEVPRGNANALRDALNVRPVAVGVDASNFQHYGGGVFNNCAANLNHGVLITGFRGHWRVKNSWGDSWGERGYIGIADGNTCGIANGAAYPK